MAYLQAHDNYDVSQDESIRRINAARRRESLTALSIGMLAVIVFGTVIYFSFHDVPAAEVPTSAHLGIGQLFR